MNNNHVNKIVSYYIYTVFFLITSNGVNFFFTPNPNEWWHHYCNEEWVYIGWVSTTEFGLDTSCYYAKQFIILMHISFIFICEELSKQFEGTSLENSEQQSKTGT